MAESTGLGTPAGGSSSRRKVQTSYKTKLHAKVLYSFSPTIRSEPYRFEIRQSSSLTNSPHKAGCLLMAESTGLEPVHRYSR